MHPCVPHYTLPNSLHSLNPRSVSFHVLPNSTRCLSLRTASLHTLPHSMHCLTPQAASVCVWPLSMRCLTLRALYVTQHAVSFDVLLHSTNFSHSTRCLAPHVLNTNLIIAVDITGIQRITSLGKDCCVSTVAKCLSVVVGL